MSTINTNGLNVNYPTPGVNNNSQGFRDNFNNIKTNLNIAATEITDLQSKVVLKQALANSTINNDMANTLISNAATRGFRASTYNLGNALSGSVLIDLSLGDVQYGTIAGDVSLSFGNWAPTGTQSNVQLEFNISNSNATITFPSEVVFSNNNFGVTTLENYANVANTPTVTVPYGVSMLDYRLSSLDCGNSITIEPFNRPRISTQIQQRTPSPKGLSGDVAGTVCIDSDYFYVCDGTYDSTIVSKTVTATYSGNLINCGSTTSLVLNSPIVFTGTTWGNITANTVYYIKTIPDGSNITVSLSGWDGTAGNTFAVSAGTGSITATSYNGTSIWNRITTGSDDVIGNLTVSYAANIGTTLSVTGNATIGNISSSGRISSTGTAGIGYNTGAGGTVTQTISRTTGVTINTTTGAITLISAAGSATYQSFTVTNSTVAATDVVILNQKSGTDNYEYFVTNVASSSFVITYRTTGGTTVEQPVFNFAVIKGVTS